MSNAKTCKIRYLLWMENVIDIILIDAIVATVAIPAIVGVVAIVTILCSARMSSHKVIFYAPYYSLHKKDLRRRMI